MHARPGEPGGWHNTRDAASRTASARLAHSPTRGNRPVVLVVVIVPRSDWSDVCSVAIGQPRAVASVVNGIRLFHVVPKAGPGVAVPVRGVVRRHCTPYAHPWCQLKRQVRGVAIDAADI